MKSVSARYIPESNDQREDPTWNWDGVRITGNSQCMGNLFEDIMNAVAMEFKIQTLAPGDTYNYYATFFGTLKFLLSRKPGEHHYFDSSFHCLVLNAIFSENDIPIRVKRKSTKNLEYALAKLEQSERIIGLSVNTAVGRHMIRANIITGRMVNVNDPFGKNPYTRIKLGGFQNYNKDELALMGVNSVIWLEKI